MLRRYFAAALLGLLCAPASAADMRPNIAAHLLPAHAEIEISETRTALTGQRSIQVACGLITVRKDAGNWATTTFAYAVDDDTLWLTTQTEWMKQPDNLGVLKVIKYCPEH